ncbi:multiple epidermal growth factor-like domains protein 10 isoform X2 [Mya arenaria]|nr:multiple epidermal growth factor-like domains protein 10 isoform X2 [Mya arenaria]XP_052761414.1 multiple epidermal growth factor-like domains protein 10 isoform X2 [Mya arenaria]
MQILKTSQRMKRNIFYWLFIYLLCKGESAIDCSGRCACCIDGELGCGTKPGLGEDTNCLKGCVDTIYGHQCKTPCKGNKCLKCSQDTGEHCNTCKKGFYGTLNNCVDSCPIRCIDNTCENDGSCTCIPNFKGNKCDTCVQGRYGDNCENTCSIGCIGETCNRNGSCSCKYNFAGTKCDLCAANYEGEKCNNCVQGKYGLLCQDTCAYINCRCRQQLGCDSCKAGFYEISAFCKTACGKGCVNATCKNDGSCSCLPNFMEPNCEKCQSGFFGNTCNRTCFYPNCKCTAEYNCDVCMEGYYNASSNCNHSCSEGCRNACQNDGSCNCKQNFNGTRCDFCDDGFYGNNCSMSCIQVYPNCLKCKRNDGFCMKCTNGFFSSNGKCFACGMNCLQGKCDPTNGRCTSGCKAGFWSDKCNAKCKLNCSSCDQFSSVCLNCTTDVVFGHFCNMSCNPSCVQSQCHHETGKCTHGCIFNRHGIYCEKECPDNCEQNDGESPCNGSGVCTNGCVVGYTGSFCKIAKKEAVSAGTPGGVIARGVSGGVVVIIGVVVAILLLRRRSLRLPASNENKRKDNKPLQPNFSEKIIKESPANERTCYNEGQIKKASTKYNSSSIKPPTNNPIPTELYANANV